MSVSYGGAVPRLRESGQATARDPFFSIEPPTSLTPVFIPRFSSTESLRQLSQQLNGLVSEVPQKWEPRGGQREEEHRIETEAEVPLRVEDVRAVELAG